jgi:TRAP-type mannitol/chloroaromatic compound transport system permease small subunit
MKFFYSYIKIVDGINEVIGKGASWLTLILVLIVCFDVFARYLLGQSSVGVQELEWHIFAVIFLAAAAFTLKYDEHVRVDVIYTRFGERTKAWVNLIGTILFLIPLCLVVIWSSHNFIINSFLMNETSPDAGGLPARYLLKALIPVSFFLLLLEGFSLMFKSIFKIKNGERESIA